MSEDIEEVEASKDRRIVVADDNGNLWSLSILSFVIFQTARELARRGQDPSDAEEISERSHDVARALTRAGWFTAEEYREAWIDSEVDDLDEELKEL